MYAAFFGLRKKPFGTVPDMSFLFKSAGFIRAYHYILYSLNTRDGIALITGEPGTGKTLLCRAAAEELQETFRIVLLEQPPESARGLLHLMLRRCGIAAGAEGRRELRDCLRDHLRENGGSVVLILDEAQALSDEVFEEVRLLSNLDDGSRPLLHIVLVGQEALRTRLAEPAHQCLAQRIIVQHQLEPLRPHEIRRYIARRLRAAGAADDPALTRFAISRIRRYSGGVPRRVNMLCDMALLAGYAEQKKKITGAMVREAARTLGGPDSARTSTARREPITRSVGVLACCGALAAVALFLLLPGSIATTPVRVKNVSIETFATPAAAHASAVSNTTAAPPGLPDAQPEKPKRQDGATMAPGSPSEPFRFDEHGIMRAAGDTQCAPEALATLLRLRGVSAGALIEARKKWRAQWQATRLFTFHDAALPFGIRICVQKHQDNETSAVRTPCIVPLSDGRYHYAVLTEITGSSAVVLDPRAGRRMLGMDEFKNIWDGNALSAFPTEPLRAQGAPAAPGA